MLEKYFNTIRWTSFSLAILLPFIAWGQSIHWLLSELTVYQIFPLLGITAWFIMAVHLILAGLKGKSKTIKSNKMFSEITGTLVLILILLHPLLLYIKLYKTGLGLPPYSVVSFVGDSLAIFVLLGTLSLLMLLSFETTNYLSTNKFVIKSWFWIFVLQYVAMIAIFIHATALGNVTQNITWFNFLWIITGLGVIVSMITAIPAQWNQQKVRNKTLQ